MRNQFFHRQRAAENQIRRFLLQIDGRAVGAEQSCVRPRRCRRRKLRCVPGAEVCANSRIRAPGREQRTACSTMPGAEAATITRSAPRPSVMRLTRSRPTSASRGSKASLRAELAAPARGALAMVSVAITRAPVRAHQHGEDQADRALVPESATTSPGCGSQLHHALQAGVHRLDEAGALEGNAVRNLFDAALARSSPSRAHIARSRRRPARIPP